MSKYIILATKVVTGYHKGSPQQGAVEDMCQEPNSVLVHRYLHVCFHAICDSGSEEVIN